MEQKRWDSNVAHARDREELDTLNNYKKEFKILINGLSSTNSPPPASGPERTVWINDVVKRLSNANYPWGRGKSYVCQTDVK